MRSLASCLLALGAGTAALQAQVVPAPSAAVGRSTLHPASIRQPVIFERNAGQLPAAAAYVAQTAAGDVTFFADGRVSVGDEPVALAGASASKPYGVDRLSAQIRYFRGSDPRRWLTDVSAYRQIQLDNVYRGIDWVWRTTPGGQLEYDFVVRPGASPDPIALQFDRKAALRVSEGDLVVTRGTSRIVHRRPWAYQEKDGRRQSIDAAWRIAGRRARLSIGAYDARYPLVIDPLLVWSEYLASSLGSGGTITAAGPDGSVVVAGGSRVSRFTASGDLVFSSSFSGGVTAAAAAVDAGGRVFVTGQTFDGGGFPIFNAAQPVSGGGLEGFVLALGPGGNLVFSTYAGGAGTDGFADLAIGPDGSLWLGGTTASSNFPSPGGFRNTLSTPRSYFQTTSPTGVIEHLTRDGQMLMASYLTTSPTGDTGPWQGASVAVGGDGAVYVGTFMEALPWVDPIHGAVPDRTPIISVLRIDPANGSPLWHKTFGWGSVQDLSVAPNGTLWVAGAATGHEGRTTTSGQLVPTADAYDGTCGTDGLCDGKSDGFLMALDGNNNTLYATYLGGAALDVVSSLRVSPQGFVWLTGRTSSTDWPDVKAGGTDGDAFVMRFTAATRTLNYVARFGGSADDWGTGIAPDPQGGAFLAGLTASPDLPARRNAIGDATTFLAYFAPLTNLLSIDRPVDRAELPFQFEVAGWAIDDRSASGTGVGGVHVWAFPVSPADPPQFLGVAAYGISRPDVAAAFGDRYDPSGYKLASSLPPGQYTIGVYAYILATQTFEAVRTVNVTVVDTTRHAIDVPAVGATVPQAFAVAGWVLDTANTTGPGIDYLDVWLFSVDRPDGFYGGRHNIGIERSDLAAAFGERFRFSGFLVPVPGTPGPFTIAIFPRLAGQTGFGAPAVVTVQVSGGS